MTKLVRRRFASVTGAALLLVGLSSAPGAQGTTVAHQNITYILPHFTGFWNSPDLAAEVAALRSRIGEGPRVKVGFTTYIYLTMNDPSVAPSNTSAIRAALAGTFRQMDDAVSAARMNGIPICLSFLTTIRDNADAVENAGEASDRRNMQWYSQNGLASHWSTYSRYARRQRRLQEAYMREVGRHLAELIAAYPETVVAGSGDGEVELAYDPSVQTDSNPSVNRDRAVLADYSPFTVAEFRDWLTQRGLYGVGQPFAGQAWELSGRYAGDSTPGVDSNGDGHTLNGDFGTAFDSWALKYFDWTLGASPDADGGAIPASTYNSAGWAAMPTAPPAGFDPPRSAKSGNPWWELWNLFRQRMVWRHNLDVARWMTTTATAAGATVPATRWYSDQIPADYLFGFTPEHPDFRLLASASPWWTADVRPYGGAGLTAFSYRDPDGHYFRTLPGVFPRIAEGKLRWGLFEWSPLVTDRGDRSDPAPFRVDTDLLAQYRPSVVAPFTWDNPDYPVKDTGFEAALRDLVARLGTEPLTLSPSTLEFGMTADGSARTPEQTVRVSGAPGEHPEWHIAYASADNFLSVAPQPGGGVSVTLTKTPPVGVTTGTVIISSNDPTYRSATLTVNVRVPNFGTSTGPVGTIDTPAPDASVAGEIGVTGWAVDDIGIAGVEIYRSPLAGEATNTDGLVPLGSATLVAGARPDVQSAYSSRPQAERAGWGYMLLTNMLPNGGNGRFTLHAFARDLDGHAVLLGSRAITAVNTGATLPFGTIDTPMQGETLSGTIVNFGWVLTPQPNVIPADGSTIGVYVDGVYLGQPVYNNARSDIQRLFPGYRNTDGAVGYYLLDTTLLSNGVHSIAWGVRDDHGNAQGIGSRYFTVSNP